MPSAMICIGRGRSDSKISGQCRRLRNSWLVVSEDCCWHGLTTETKINDP
jgi:hypothetical protein